MYLFEECAITAQIAYFFCEFDNEASTNATTIMSSLAKQLLNAQEMTENMRIELSVLLRPGRPSIEGLRRLLRYAAAKTTTQFILIDALDECADEDRKIVLNVLDDLIADSSCNVKIAISARLEYDKYYLRSCNDYYMIDTSSPEARYDLDMFIDALIQIKVAEGDLVVNDPALLIEIYDAFRDRADGM